jgi:hypothetical protein
MSSVATRAPTGSGAVRLSPALKAKLYGSTIEQERFLAGGGTLAQWYAQAAAPPALTEQDRRTAELARVIRLMPDGLDPDEQADYIAAAERRVRR